MKQLFDLNSNDCRYVVSSQPSMFCAEPQREGSSYCDAHHKACHSGFGKNWQALAGMMDAMELHVRKTSEFKQERPETAAVDTELREGK